MKTRALLLMTTVCLSGCIGYDAWTPLQEKPYTYLKGGDQLGRDTLQNRSLVAARLFPVKGMDSHDLLTILGQPQSIKIVEREVAEDWFFIYYKNHVAYTPRFIPPTKQKLSDNKEGSFLVRIYNGKVLDVVNID